MGREDHEIVKIKNYKLGRPSITSSTTTTWWWNCLQFSWIGPGIFWENVQPKLTWENVQPKLTCHKTSRQISH